MVARNRGRKTISKSTLCNNRYSPKLLAGNTSNVETVILTNTAKAEESHKAQGTPQHSQVGGEAGR